MREYRPVVPNPNYFTAMAWQHFRATNDSNGNPRRLYVVYDEDADIGALIDEGYSGMPKYLIEDEVPQLPTIDVSVAQYNQLKRFAKQTGVYYQEM